MGKMANKLYQLPNGDWVDPKTVKSVMAVDNADPGIERICRTQIPPRVVVWHGDNKVSVREYATFELACLARDKVALEINEACRAESEGRNAV